MALPPHCVFLGLDLHSTLTQEFSGFLGPSWRVIEGGDSVWMGFFSADFSKEGATGGQRKPLSLEAGHSPHSGSG